jgi:hypothetical protein
MMLYALYQKGVAYWRDKWCKLLCALCLHNTVATCGYQINGFQECDVP